MTPNLKRFMLDTIRSCLGTALDCNHVYLLTDVNRTLAVEPSSMVPLALVVSTRFTMVHRLPNSATAR